MSTIGASTGVRSVPPATSGAPAASSATVAATALAGPSQSSAFSISAALASLIEGLSISGLVVAQDGARSILQLPDGRLLSFIHPGIRLGQQVTLQVLKAEGALIRALLSALDGEPLSARAPLELTIEAPDPSRRQTEQRQSSKLPDILSGRLLQPAKAGDGRAPIHLPQGSEIVFKVIAGAPDDKTAALPEGTTLRTGIRLTALPLEIGKNGQWMLRTAVGVVAVALPNGVRLPPAIELEVSEIVIHERASAPTQALGSLFSHLGDEWHDLERAIGNLATIAPPALHRLQLALPAFGDKGIDRLFTFLTGLRRGDFERMVRDEVMAQALDRSPNKLLARRIAEDIRELARLEAEQPQSEWRGVALPLLDGPRVLPIWIFHRQRRRKGEDGTSQPTRFIIEFTLSQVGPIQMDGLLKNRIFDLVIRAQRQLRSQVTADLEEIFVRNLSAAGLGGSLQFQAVTKFSVSPLDDLRRRSASRSVAV